MDTVVKTAEKIGKSSTLKIFVLGILILLMLIPVGLVMSLINEREVRNRETVEKINAKWSKSQTLSGPVLVVPYSVIHMNEENKPVSSSHNLHIAPSLLDIDVQLVPEIRHLGIYKSILYKSEVSMKGSLDTKIANKLSAETNAKVLINWSSAYLKLGISDLRGVVGKYDFVVNDKVYVVNAGSGVVANKDGESLMLSPSGESNISENTTLKFDCKFQLNGSANINFIPVGKTTKVKVNGDWTAPGFIGNFTPTYTINKNNFVANWEVLHLNRNIPEMWIDNNISNFSGSVFGVSLVDTIDNYQQNLRSAKYAVMFIGLTFLVFFLFEMMTKVRIHPVQYLLVGFALVLFFTLLLSISEHLTFGYAYLIASFATISLITVYMKNVLHSNKSSLIILSFLAALYTFLYVLLQLEDIALLIGSIGLFLIIAMVMYFSRKINWYKPIDNE